MGIPMVFDDHLMLFNGDFMVFNGELLEGLECFFDIKDCKKLPQKSFPVVRVLDPCCLLVPL